MKREESSDGSTSLDQRLDRETRFHDAKYGGADLYPRHYAVRPTEFVYQQLRQRLGNIEGRSVLEYGCGEGWVTRDLAGMGADVSAFDISPQAVEQTSRVLQRNGLLQRCRLDVMAAEKLTYVDDSFDLAIGFAIIHHLDLKLALKELHRVLRPGGVAHFAEPLGTNPAIELYRRLTPQFRTADERPLVIAEFPELFQAFSSYSHDEYFLTALSALGIAYAPGGPRVYPAISNFLHRVDRMILKRFPQLGRWAWYSIVSLRK